MGSGVITFLSDFGIRDAYVAEVKGAILSLDPRLRVVDITHDVPPQDIREGAFQLFRAASAFPAGTVHLAVVDPGVGTARRPVLAQAGDQVLVGPDNGILSWAGRGGPTATTWRLIDCPDLYRSPLSRTFHGRDLFGPVAAAVACGRLDPGDCGPLVQDPVVLPWPPTIAGPGSVRCEVILADRFGNLILGVRAAEIVGTPADGRVVRIAVGGRSFKAVWGLYDRDSELVVHEDSSGLLEVAVPGDSAAGRLDADTGAAVELSWD